MNENQHVQPPHGSSARRRSRRNVAHVRTGLAGIVAASALVAGFTSVTPAAGALAEASGATPAGQDPDVRARALLGQMTLEEKIDLMTGDQGGAPSAYYNAPIPRLGIPELRMADAGGGIAARGWENPATGDRATTFPTGAALGATWNSSLAALYGRTVAREAKATGHAVLLGPGSDMTRQPFWGRAAEGISEDPLLTSSMTTPYVDAVQKEDVIATLKHYLAHTQETNRGNSQNVVVDERALREVYAAPYEDAIKKAGLGSVMCAFNKVNDVFACESDLALNQILRDELGFTGYVITDFGAIHSTEPSVRAGTDMETGTSSFYDGALLAAVDDGRVSTALIDRSVLRILRTMFAVGVFDEDYPTTPLDVRAGGDAARRVATQSVTLLQNRYATLPMTRRVRSAVVIGADADVTGRLGGSFAVKPADERSLVDELTAQGEDAGIRVRHVDGNDRVNGASMIETADMTAVPSSVLTPTSGSGRGLTTQHYGDTTYGGTPVTRVEPQVAYDTGFTGGGKAFANLYASQVAPVPYVGDDGNEYNQSARWTGSLRAPADGDYRLGLTGWGDARLFVDDRLVADMTGQDGRRTVSGTVSLARGQRAAIRIEYAATRPLVGLQPGSLLFQWSPPTNATSPAIREAVRAARSSDVAVVYVRTYETEERDRVSLKLPQSADQMISAVAAANPRTVVVLSTGGPVTMPWRGQVASVLQTYQGGQEEGTALARVLLGRTNPSGRLPMTYPRDEQSLPPGAENPWDGIADSTITYAEGVNNGYRGYVAAGVRPMYPFGFGLSYTSFDYRGLSTGSLRAVGGRDSVRVKVRVRNTGRRAGTEVVQVYAGPLPGQSAPARKLVGFARISLRARTSGTATVTVDRRQLSYWDADTDRWVTPRGAVRLLVGSSATDVRLRGEVRVR